MKTSLTKLKSSLILVLAVVAAPLWAKPVAQVTNISGQAFMVTPNGETVTLKVNDHLEEKAEVMVEEGSSITLNDYYDATYHLTGGSHMKFYNKSVQLKQGKTWVQAENSNHPLALTTANGHVDYLKSEFITTFDHRTARSQVLVVNGDVDVSNVLDRNMKYTVSAGTFTLIDPDVENGIPRAPTRVGLSSLNSALAEFKGVSTPGTIAPARGIASVQEKQDPRPVKKGHIIYIKRGRIPASVSAHGYYKKTATKKKTVKVAPVPIKFYGTTWNGPVKKVRKPASIAPIKVPKNGGETLNIDPEFTESLKKQTQLQPKHPKELQNLIDDLKSY